MKIEDKLYGKKEIKEKILIDLINSPSIQRLKDISQLGMPDEYMHLKGFSRYEHSLGVMFFLKKIGASLEEQIAGLLHDASHTPFSHVIDWVLGDPTKEDYQDKIHKTFLENSEIPSILKKHNFNTEFIYNLKNFTLLEKKAPSLCADRLDYSLRQIKIKDKRNLTQRVLNNLSVRNNQIVFLDEKIAENFAEEYMCLQKYQWAGDQARTRYHILSEILKKALEKDLINFEDFKKTETPILQILNESKEKFILDNLCLLKKGFRTTYDENGIELKKKFRYIDPEILVNGSYFPLSKLSKSYFNLIESEKKQKDEIRKIKIIPN
jgi:hypothetical protein